MKMLGKTLPCLLVTLLSLNVQAAKLEKLDPMLRNAVDEATASGLDAATISVEVLVMVSGRTNVTELREKLTQQGLEVWSVTPGASTIVSGKGTLQTILNLSDDDAVTVIQGSQIMFPEPSFSLGN